jgi:hypothetical protein
MAGHIAGLGYSQRMDVNGDPLAGAKLYIFDAGTSTPSSVFEDYALSIEHTHPITADAAGIIPMFWVDDGFYRARLTDSSGNEIFDDDNIAALGPSSGSGGGGGSSTPESAIFTTGDMLWNAVSGSRTGWVRCNARTVGSVASGATERASSDAEELFTFLWNNFSNSLCAVSGGRGANAAADWSANKTIATLDMRDKAPFGLSDMGSTSTGVLGTTPGSGGGASTVTLAQANLPVVNFSHSLFGQSHAHVVAGNTGVESAVHTHTGVTSSDGAHTHAYLANNSDTSVQLGGANTLGGDNASINTSSNGTHSHTVATGGQDVNHFHAFSVASGLSGALPVTGTVSSGGSATATGIMNPYRLGTWYMKL